MKNRYTSIVCITLVLIIITSCHRTDPWVCDITFGISSEQAHKRARMNKITMEKCDQWYPRIDTFFCFIEQYGFPHVVLFLEFFEDRLYAMRYILDDNNNPLQSYNTVFSMLKKEFGDPETTKEFIPPTVAHSTWDEHCAEILKKGGFVSAQWKIPNKIVKLKLYAGSYYNEIEWQYYDKEMFEAVQKFKRSIILQP